jgi:UDP-N-acetylmuramoylalanine--D-glutamate ligase
MKYVIYGLGISGISAAKFLAKNGESVVACDDNEKSLIENQKKFPDINFSKFDEIDFDKNTIISFAPGIPLYFPKPHKILETVKKTGASLACDVEILYRRNPKKKFIGITGTNGKSTTTALSGFIFKELRIASDFGGNIGVPCFDLDQSKDDFTYILETSSFQLDLLSQTHFGISALLNITPDHIDRHGSMENYIIAKKRIFQNQTENDFALIDIDNENSRKVFLELQNDKNFKAKLVPISTKEIQKNGISLFDGKLTCNIAEPFEVELKSEFLRGSHNDQNMAFAFAITYCYLKKFSKRDIEISQIITAIKKFPGLRHRMQIIGMIDDIRFVNDSKATNAESTEHALKTYKNVFWIVGGTAKEGGISVLKPLFKNVEKAYLIGEASDAFAEVLKENSVNFEKCGNLENAFKKSYSDAKNSSLTEKNILLSPSCASFDQWKSFEQRGDYFCKLFDELSKS